MSPPLTTSLPCSLPTELDARPYAWLQRLIGVHGARAASLRFSFKPGRSHEKRMSQRGFFSLAQHTCSSSAGGCFTLLTCK